MLDTAISIPIQRLLEKPTILELDAVGDDREKAFIIGLILMTIYEHYRAEGLVEGTSLKHVTVVEEAHRILKDTSGTSRLDVANMAGKAVEDFSQILAEIRAYGEGVVIAEQIPSKLSSDIIKLTNLKITHRIISADDRQLLSGSMIMTAEQARWLASCATGEAVVFGEEDDNPIRLRIPYQKETGVVSAEDIRASMATIRSSNAWLFHRFGWSPVEARLIQKHLREAQYIATNPEFQERFRQYVISSVIDPMLFQTGLFILKQVVRKKTHHSDCRNLLRVVLTVSTQQLFESLGDKFHTPYEDIAKIKFNFTELVFAILDIDKELDLNLSEKDHLSRGKDDFQRTFKKFFFGNYFPYSGCEKVCLNNTCAYRHFVSPLMKNKRLIGEFDNALRYLDSNKRGQEAQKICKQATRRILVTSEIIPSSAIPASEQRKVGLCFAIQVGDILPDLDGLLRTRLLDGLLPYMSSD